LIIKEIPDLQEKITREVKTSINSDNLTDLGLKVDIDNARNKISKDILKRLFKNVEGESYLSVIVKNTVSHRIEDEECGNATEIIQRDLQELYKKMEDTLGKEVDKKVENVRALEKTSEDVKDKAKKEKTERAKEEAKKAEQNLEKAREDLEKQKDKLKELQEKREQEKKEYERTIDRVKEEFKERDKYKDRLEDAKKHFFEGKK
jgi:chromosome segregation ATPase